MAAMPQPLSCLVSCAKSLNMDGYGDRIRFIIYGDGPDREVLQKRCLDEHAFSIGGKDIDGSISIYFIHIFREPFNNYSLP